MKRMGVLRLCVILLLVFMLVGCNRKSAENYTIPFMTNPDYPTMKYPYLCTTLGEYYDLLRNSNIPKGYLSYDDISFIGEFYSYSSSVPIGGTPQEYHEVATYRIEDQAGYIVLVNITMRESEKRHYPRENDFERLATHDNFRNAPESYPENAKEGTTIEYGYNEIIYSYSEQSQYGGEPYLSSIRWVYDDYHIIIIPGFQGGEDRWDGSTYPECATDTFVGRLLNPETAQDAVNQFNAVIRWANFRDSLIEWLPVIIPVVCVAATGTVYLIIRRKRKKAATKATHETEPKTEE